MCACGAERQRKKRGVEKTAARSGWQNHRITGLVAGTAGGGGAVPYISTLGKIFFQKYKFWPKIRHSGAFKENIYILSTDNHLCRKFAAVSPKIATSSPPLAACEKSQRFEATTRLEWMTEWVSCVEEWCVAVCDYSCCLAIHTLQCIVVSSLISTVTPTPPAAAATQLPHHSSLQDQTRVSFQLASAAFTDFSRILLYLICLVQLRLIFVKLCAIFLWMRASY